MSGRSIRHTLLTGVITAALLLSVSGRAGAVSVAGTKHNFGTFGVQDITSADTSEICVFCHTPHQSNPAHGTWNKDDSAATYDLYSSDTIVVSPGVPSGGSKLCLSCHDGTIALGAILNAPGPAEADTFTVTGPGVTAGKLTSTSTAYIGTDLRDDHPISFSYSGAYSGEHEDSQGAGFPDEISLENGKVQCASCHDPHGTTNPNFLVLTMEDGTLCEGCHTKYYWNASVGHQSSTSTWNGTGQNPFHIDMGAAGYTNDTVTQQSCLACHKSHGGKSGSPLLTGVNPTGGLIENSEWTCLNCHNGNVATTDIDSVVDYTSVHDVKSATQGSHTPDRATASSKVRETQVSLGSTLNSNRHAECADCHNPHGSQPGTHTVGGTTGNMIGPTLIGTWGVQPTWAATAETASTIFTEIDFASVVSTNLEAYLCAKCHTSYATTSTPPSVPSQPTGTGTDVKISDLTVNFNENNYSLHPAFDTQGKNRPGVNANPNWVADGIGLTETFVYKEYGGAEESRSGFYLIKHTDQITCSDCHGSSSTVDPAGPHGSNNKWILRSNETGTGHIDNFCLNCHRRDVYGDDDYFNPTNRNLSRVQHPVDGDTTASPFYKVAGGGSGGRLGNGFGIVCMTCHGGAAKTVNGDHVFDGVHGSHTGAGGAGGADELGKRMMNGACVTGHTHATTATNDGADMYFKTATDEVCTTVFTDFVSTEKAVYDYWPTTWP